MRKYTSTLSYILCIILLNALFVKLPGFHPFGDTFSAADIIVGAIYIVRDFAQREIGHYILLAMAVGTAISYALSDPTIAIASAGAFAIGELCDWTLFTITKKPLSQRLLISSLVSIPIDSWVFLALANRFNIISMSLMLLGKTLGVLALWWLWRARQNNEQAN